MAVDSAGYTTDTPSTSPFAQSSLFSATNYDPTNSLQSGLQAAATYDPSIAATTNPSSISGALKSQLQSTNTDAGQSASTTQNLQSVYTPQIRAVSPAVTQAAASNLAGLYSANGGNLFAAVQQNAVNNVNATAQGVTTVNNGNTSGLAYGVGGTAASGAASTPQAANNNLTTYGGPGIVSVRTADGNYAYYTFNQNLGTYTFAGLYNQNGAQQAAVGANGQIAPLFANLSAQDRANATLTNIGVGQQLGANQVANAGNLIATQYATQLGAWNTANQAAAANQNATANAATSAATQQQVLDYMTTHDGALPPGLANLSQGTIVGGNGNLQAQQAAITAAQTAYQAQLAHASALNALQPAAINTANVDNTNQQALNSLVSQYATSGPGGLASRVASNQAASLVGQNRLSHETAAATQYDNNLSAFGTALSNQNTYDAQATGNQLYTDIQSVSDLANRIQQQTDQLGATARQQANTQLNYLNQQIQAYQAAVQAYGQSASQTITIAKGILSSAAQVASAVA